MRFVGRDDEMRLLDRIYSKENIKTCMIYGRRRIGKTMMLRRFVEDKPHIYIEFDKNATETVHLSVIASELSDFLGKEVSFPTFRHAMKAIEDVCKEKKIVVVFDELPYLTKSCPHAASEIQHLTDHLVRDTESMIIVCGSSI